MGRRSAARVVKTGLGMLVGFVLSVISAGTVHAISYAYVSAYDDDAVKKIQLSNNTVVATITVGNGPAGGCLSPDGLFFYVPNYLTTTVSVISTVTDAVVATIT